jgi:hypothetical protein
MIRYLSIAIEERGIVVILLQLESPCRRQLRENYGEWAIRKTFCKAKFFSKQVVSRQIPTEP